MKRVLFAILIVGLICLCGCGEAKKGQRLAGQQMSISTPIVVEGLAHTVDLGTMSEGETVTKTVRLHNIDTSPFVVKSILAGCPCLTFGYTKEPIAPDGEMTLEITFDSRGFAGEIVRDVDLFTSFAKKPMWLRIVAKIK